MKNIIIKALEAIISEIQEGNSNITAEEAVLIIDTLKSISDKQYPISKYQACKILNISRSKFDTLVSQGKIPKGRKQQGFKELFWTTKDLENLQK